MTRVANRKHLHDSVRTTGWLVADRIARLPITLLVGVTLARSLGPEAFGRYSYALALILLLQGIASLGLRSVLVRYLAGSPGDTRTFVATAFRLRLVAGLIAWAIIAIPAWHGGASATEAGLVGILGATLVAQVGEIFDLWFQAQRRAERAVRVAFFPHVLESVALIAAALMAANLYLIAAIRVAGAVGTSAMLWRAYRRAGGPSPLVGYDRIQAILLLKQAWPVVLSGLFIPIYKRSDQIMLRHLADAAEVGQYSLASSVAEAGAFLPSMIVVSLFPLLVAAKARTPAEYESAFVRMLSVLFVVGLVLAFGVSIGGWIFIPLVYGEDYAPARSMAAVYVWGQVFMAVRAGISRWLIIEERLRESLYTHALGAAINIGLNFLLIPHWGGVGAALATLVSYTVASYVGFWGFAGTRSIPGYWHQAVGRVPAACQECWTILREMSASYLNQMRKKGQRN